MTVRRRLVNLGLAVLADTWADLTGLIEEVRAESRQGPAIPVLVRDEFPSRGPIGRKRHDTRIRSGRRA